MSTSPRAPKELLESVPEKRLAYISTSDGFRDTIAPPYQYEALNLQDEVVRLLILEPCSGDKNDPYNYVRGSFKVQPLASAEPFIAIKNGRGFRLLQEVIEINEHSFLVSTALEKLLRNIRKDDQTIRLWVRYVCVDQGNPDEMSKYWNRDFVDKVYASAQSVVDMHTVLNELLDQGIIEKSVDTRYKEWNKNWNSMPEELPLPKVYPIKLGQRPSNEQPTDDYEYLPLDNVASEIRIIVIANNPDPEAPLILHLAHCPIASDVAYHALSYTWGVDTEFEEIVVNGQKMKIRKNLEAALRSLRSPTHGFAIWADAICINQGDVDEKNRGIAKMGDVLDKAVGVVCYVGEPDEYSDLALDLVKHLQEPLVRFDKDGHYEVGKPERIPPEELPRHCAALYVFLIRPFFRRQWILQEITLASYPVIACGRRRDVLFERLDSAAYNLQDMLSRDPQFAEKVKKAIPQLKEVSADQLLFVRKLFYFRHLHVGHSANRLLPVAISRTAPGYLESAILSRDFQATVPHDSIFALWNIARDKSGLKVQMDYTKTYQAAFLEFAKAWALHSGSLDILGAVEYILPSEQASFYATAPSWCPDWNTSSQSSSLVRREVFRKFQMAYQDDIDGPLYAADGGLRQSTGTDEYFEFVDDELHCLGVILDTIMVGGRVPKGSSIKDQVEGIVPSVTEYCDEHKKEVYDDVAQAVVAMIHGDVPTSWPRREDNLENAVEDNAKERYVCIPYKPRTNAEQTPNASRHVPWYGGSYSRQEASEAVGTIMRGREDFITEKGYIGLMPQYVDCTLSSEKVDSGLRLAILATCSVPVLLHEHPERKGTYRLLGTCFVQGWMEGEVLKQEMGCDSPKEFWDAMVGSEKLRIV
ncbi:hypothetical protein H2200_001143 [Cladophialophora chaetospira]|uniref:Heterokaryon incompatibility domain-containing protein n=1 Tax=Cladophialophora chaetospira TaxID=386627 RepID=A0AA39CNS6_9EURO|nr:hypothetical protein H2200_001143 [Cladophialophora chaetospira]